MSSITEAEHRAAPANLYADAAARVDASWPPGRLEKRSAQLHSSQALCVSVLETIADRPREKRFCRPSQKKPISLRHSASPVEIAAEVRRHREVLGETGAGTPTSLDGPAHWPGGVLTVESKFGGPEVGAA
jgi:hypothetical protein